MINVAKNVMLLHFVWQFNLLTFECLVSAAVFGVIFVILAVLVAFLFDPYVDSIIDKVTRIVSLEN